MKRGKREEINMRAKVGTPWPKRDNQPICLFRFFSTKEERERRGASGRTCRCTGVCKGGGGGARPPFSDCGGGNRKKRRKRTDRRGFGLCKSHGLRNRRLGAERPGNTGRQGRHVKQVPAASASTTGLGTGRSQKADRECQHTLEWAVGEIIRTKNPD